MPPKKELIRKYTGKEVDAYGHNPTVWDAVVLLEVTEDWVFGFYQYMDKKKHFFKRKLEYTRAREPRPYFRWNRQYYFLDEFTRCSSGVV